VAAVSNLASAAGYWQSVSSRVKPTLLLEETHFAFGGNPLCFWGKPTLLLGETHFAFGGNPRLTVRELLQSQSGEADGVVVSFAGCFTIK